MSDWVDAWKAAGENADLEAAKQTLNESVVLISPLTNQFCFSGRDEVLELLESVFVVTSDYRYTEDVRDGRRAVLFATTVVGETELSEMQQIELDSDGRLARVTVMMRPLPALTAFARAIGPVIAKRQGRSNAARTLSIAGAFLDGVAKSGDKKFIPLAAPHPPTR